jgi:hypothetical protein
LVASGKSKAVRTTDLPAVHPHLHRVTLPDLSRLTVAELLALYTGVLDELRARGTVRSSNKPIGDYAELLFCQAFGWSREGNSKKGHDAVDVSGIRYQIKSRRPTVHNASRQVSALQKLDEGRFEVLAGVVFNEDFTVHRAALVPHGTVLERAKFVDGWGWRFQLHDSLWAIPRVRDVTEELRAAQR